MPSKAEDRFFNADDGIAYLRTLRQIARRWPGQLPTEEIEVSYLLEQDIERVHNEWRSPLARQKININWHRLMVRTPRRMAFSIRCGGKLCGIMVASYSRRHRNVNLRYLEGCPWRHPLRGKVLKIALIILENLAWLYGADRASVSQPETGLIPLYRQAGYGLIPADADRARRDKPVRARLLVKQLRRPSQG